MAIFDYSYNDFTGFTFNGKHSSEFKVLRTNDGGDRYQDILVPDVSDNSEEVPGGVGEYYFGSSFGVREFSINIAYDELNEADKRRLKKWLYPDHSLHELIFDERPYIKYWVKLSKAPEFDELCFDNKENGQRVYKGEAKLDFTAYMPYGMVVDKKLDSEIYDKYNNIDQWGEASGLLAGTALRPLDKFVKSGKTWISRIYNPGDFDTDWVASFAHNTAGVKFTLKSIPSESGATGKGAIDYEDTYTPDTNHEWAIFINGKKYNMKYENDSWYYTFNNIEYHCSVSGSYFINDYGETYKGYIYENVAFATYNVQGLADTDEPFLIYLTDGKHLNCFYVSLVLDGIAYINHTYWAYVLFGDDYYVNELSGGQSVADSYNFSLYDGSELKNEFTLTFPATLYSNPNNIGEVETAAVNDCEIKIDTQKQTINYRYKTDGTNYTPWTGISGLITAGELFKLPQSELGAITQRIVITPTSSEENFITDPTIEYTYLYK